MADDDNLMLPVIYSPPPPDLAMDLGHVQTVKALDVYLVNPPFTSVLF